MEERRSNKYNNSDTTPVINSRVNKNKLLYDELNSKIGFEEVKPVDEQQIDLSSLDLKKPKREEYHKIKDYRNLFATDTNKTYEEKREFKPKNFDINLVLEEAKKNRKNIDELEKKRNINNDEYNLLSNLNKKYLHKKDFSADDEEELKELIDTITSNTLREDIQKATTSDDEENSDEENSDEDNNDEDLFSELLASTTDIKLESNLTTQDVSKIYSEINDYQNNNNNNNDDDDNKNNTEDLEDSFYTRSLEFSNEDLLTDEELDTDDESYKDKNNVKIVMISLLLIFMLLIVIYFLFKHFGIAFK